MTALNLGAPAAILRDEEGDIIGGSSPTTLTEPLTESELTEDEDDMDERKPDPAEAPDEDDALDVSDDGEDDMDDADDGDDGKAAEPIGNRR